MAEVTSYVGRLVDAHDPKDPDTKLATYRVAAESLLLADKGFPMELKKTDGQNDFPEEVRAHQNLGKIRTPDSFPRVVLAFRP